MKVDDYIPICENRGADLTYTLRLRADIAKHVLGGMMGNHAAPMMPPQAAANFAVDYADALLKRLSE